MKKNVTHSPGFTDAVTKITLSDMFFTTLLYDLDSYPDEKLSARGEPAIAATNGVKLVYNPKLYDARTSSDRVFILLHEILHGVLMHSTRRGLRDPFIWNVAADFVVNGMLFESGRKLPADALFDKKYLGMLTEPVYDDLVTKCGGNSAGGGKGDATDGKGLMMEDIMDFAPGKGDTRSVREIEQDVAIRLKKAAMQAKAAGQLHGAMERFVDSVTVEKTPWYDVLSRYMNKLVSQEYSWARVDFKRSQYYGCLIPDTKVVKVGNIVVAIDCSGSISQAQLSSIAANIRDVVADCRPMMLTVMYFDTKVSHVDQFSPDEFHGMSFKVHGGGGTDFRCVATDIEAHYSDAVVALVFTDMYGPFSDNCSVDTIWVTSSTQFDEPPYGEIIKADFND